MERESDEAEDISPVKKGKKPIKKKTPGQPTIITSSSDEEVEVT